ncbi:MAG TPA: hypothetical protein VGR15_01630, partial [Bacteroidota bacterium]|nr:hypothetical protein [Bacteroidota bacterium]
MTNFGFRIVDFSAGGARQTDVGLGSAPGGGLVSPEVHDVLGRTIATIVDEELPPGVYERSWDA